MKKDRLQRSNDGESCTQTKTGAREPRQLGRARSKPRRSAVKAAVAELRQAFDQSGEQGEAAGAAGPQGHCLCCPLHPAHGDSLLFVDYLYLLHLHSSQGPDPHRLEDGHSPRREDQELGLLEPHVAAHPSALLTHRRNLLGQHHPHTSSHQALPSAEQKEQDRGEDQEHHRTSTHEALPPADQREQGRGGDQAAEKRGDSGEVREVRITPGRHCSPSRPESRQAKEPPSCQEGGGRAVGGDLSKEGGSRVSGSPRSQVGDTPHSVGKRRSLLSSFFHRRKSDWTRSKEKMQGAALPEGLAAVSSDSNGSGHFLDPAKLPAQKESAGSAKCQERAQGAAASTRFWGKSKPKLAASEKPIRVKSDRKEKVKHTTDKSGKRKKAKCINEKTNTPRTEGEIPSLAEFSENHSKSRRGSLARTQGQEEAREEVCMESAAAGGKARQAMQTPNSLASLNSVPFLNSSRMRQAEQVRCKRLPSPQALTNTSSGPVKPVCKLKARWLPNDETPAMISKSPRLHHESFFKMRPDTELSFDLSGEEIWETIKPESPHKFRITGYPVQETWIHLLPGRFLESKPVCLPSPSLSDTSLFMVDSYYSSDGGSFLEDQSSPLQPEPTSSSKALSLVQHHPLFCFRSVSPPCIRGPEFPPSSELGSLLSRKNSVRRKNKLSEHKSRNKTKESRSAHFNTGYGPFESKHKPESQKSKPSILKNKSKLPRALRSVSSEHECSCISNSESKSLASRIVRNKSPCRKKSGAKTCPNSSNWKSRDSSNNSGSESSDSRLNPLSRKKSQTSFTKTSFCSPNLKSNDSSKDLGSESSACRTQQKSSKKKSRTKPCPDSSNRKSRNSSTNSGSESSASRTKQVLSRKKPRTKSCTGSPNEKSSNSSNNLGSEPSASRTKQKSSRKKSKTKISPSSSNLKSRYSRNNLESESQTSKANQVSSRKKPQTNTCPSCSNQKSRNSSNNSGSDSSLSRTNQKSSREKSRIKASTRSSYLKSRNSSNNSGSESSASKTEQESRNKSQTKTSLCSSNLKSRNSSNNSGSESSASRVKNKSSIKKSQTETCPSSSNRKYRNSRHNLESESSTSRIKQKSSREKSLNNTSPSSSNCISRNSTNNSGSESSDARSRQKSSRKKALFSTQPCRSSKPTLRESNENSESEHSDSESKSESFLSEKCTRTTRKKLDKKGRKPKFEFSRWRSEAAGEKRLPSRSSHRARRSGECPRSESSLLRSGKGSSEYMSSPERNRSRTSASLTDSASEGEGETDQDTESLDADVYSISHYNYLYDFFK